MLIFTENLPRGYKKKNMPDEEVAFYNLPLLQMKSLPWKSLRKQSWGPDNVLLFYYIFFLKHFDGSIMIVLKHLSVFNVFIPIALLGSREVQLLRFTDENQHTERLGAKSKKGLGY